MMVSRYVYLLLFKLFNLTFELELGEQYIKPIVDIISLYNHMN